MLTSSSFSRTPFLFFLRKSLPLLRPFSFTATPYPLYYDLVRHRPVQPHSPRHRRSGSGSQPEPEPEPDPDSSLSPPPPLDRSQRKYYRKRAKRMFGGSDSESDSSAAGGDMVELKPEIVDFPRLHAREQELYFYDAFAFPWEKDKHYRMVYQLEKKYFPDQGIEKAFVSDNQVVVPTGERKPSKKNTQEEKDDNNAALVFFEEEEKKPDVSERKVQEFFKCLKKVPSEKRKEGNGMGFVGAEEAVEPFFTTRKTELPPRLGLIENARKHLFLSAQHPDLLELQKLQSVERHLERCAESRMIGDWKSCRSFRGRKPPAGFQ